MATTIRVVIPDVEGPSMAKAIRKKCLDCSGGYTNEVRDCWATNCPLFPYRFGANPKAAIRALQKTYTVDVIQVGKEGGQHGTYQADSGTGQ